MTITAVCFGVGVFFGLMIRVSDHLGKIRDNTKAVAVTNQRTTDALENIVVINRRIAEALEKLVKEVDKK